jgi:uncharacterized protein involved in cysteine biosynthesis
MVSSTLCDGIVYTVLVACGLVNYYLLLYTYCDAPFNRYRIDIRDYGRQNNQNQSKLKKA